MQGTPGREPGHDKAQPGGSALANGGPERLIFDAAELIYRHLCWL